MRAGMRDVSQMADNDRAWLESHHIGEQCDDVEVTETRAFTHKLHWHTCSGCGDKLPCWCSTPSLTPLDIHAMRRGEKPKEEKPIFCLECKPFDRRKVE